MFANVEGLIQYFKQSPVLPPGWVAPNDWSTCSIVGCIWGELKWTPLKSEGCHIKKFIAMADLFTTKSNRYIKMISKQGTYYRTYQYFSLTLLILFTSII